MGFPLSVVMFCAICHLNHLPCYGSNGYGSPHHFLGSLGVSISAGFRRGHYDFCRINYHLAQFRHTFHNKPYERQKCRLEERLNKFFRQALLRKECCTEEDIVRFLISLDSRSKTKVHARSCRRASITTCYFQPA